jgi:hypothetical protein
MLGSSNRNKIFNCSLIDYGAVETRVAGFVSDQVDNILAYAQKYVLDDPIPCIDRIKNIVPEHCGACDCARC